MILGERPFYIAHISSITVIFRLVTARGGIDFTPPVQSLQEFAPNGRAAVPALAGTSSLERCRNFVRKGSRAEVPNGLEPAPSRGDGISR
ncbi:MAG TPA: hypothetical protein VK525_12360 [Candidatus Saccharimonadales bacterium]|nr:hypothetical protein [Candidatus Saccharimonadales bacterium]